jgi:hypothetical protein
MIGGTGMDFKKGRCEVVCRVKKLKGMMKRVRVSGLTHKHSYDFFWEN